MPSCQAWFFRPDSIFSVSLPTLISSYQYKLYRAIFRYVLIVLYSIRIKAGVKHIFEKQRLSMVESALKEYWALKNSH